MVTTHGTRLSPGRILTLLVIGPATALTVAVALHFSDYQHYTPDPSEVRTVTESGWGE